MGSGGVDSWAVGRLSLKLGTKSSASSSFSVGEEIDPQRPEALEGDPEVAGRCMKDHPIPGAGPVEMAPFIAAGRDPSRLRYIGIVGGSEGLGAEGDFSDESWDGLDPARRWSVDAIRGMIYFRGIERSFCWARASPTESEFLSI